MILERKRPRMFTIILGLVVAKFMSSACSGLEWSGRKDSCYDYDKARTNRVYFSSGQRCVIDLFEIFSMSET